ncbi:hypothetical protein [Paraburkholderia lycopersici]|uniref:Uncharacterized protein n=1 Tax=Paraburkholderia lycopersici TaxID=416944 RepID=A0A1G6Q3B4_9BURK|nr:hypothetical protein [Paraburkholderia lycopersici]SDC86434.1 hypothetical protein SAMN05421548_11159 [Paraburkholderia lycopersici]
MIRMSTQYLRDRQFRIIGSIETDSTGKQVGRDARFNRVGEYDPKAGQTRGSRFQIVGTGNQLAPLIWRTVR